MRATRRLKDLESCNLAQLHEGSAYSVRLLVFYQGARAGAVLVGPFIWSDGEAQIHRKPHEKQESNLERGHGELVPNIALPNLVASQGRFGPVRQQQARNERKVSTALFLQEPEGSAKFVVAAF